MAERELRSLVHGGTRADMSLSQPLRGQYNEITLYNTFTDLQNIVYITVE